MLQTECHTFIENVIVSIHFGDANKKMGMTYFALLKSMANYIPRAPFGVIKNPLASLGLLLFEKNLIGVLF